jgi:anti-anti-sigma regulatory factor
MTPGSSRRAAGLFFANADYVRARIRKSAEAADPRAVVLDDETSPSIDVTAAQMLANLANNLRSRGTRLLVARDVGQVRDVLRRVEVPEIVVGVYATVDAAVEAALGSRGRSRPPSPMHGRWVTAGSRMHTPRRTPTATTRLRMGAMRIETQEGRDALSMIHRYGPEEAGGSMSAGQQ